MLDTAVAPCERCPTGATRAVATRGPVPARLLLLSGAPRHHEEHEGVAFASPAFGWLEAALSAAGLDPSSVHYATLIGCRPPHQRPLRGEEISACGERLDVTVNAVAPEVIVLCGADVVAAMVPGVTLSTGHGRLVVRGRRRYYPIRHPYTALHHQPYVAEVEADLQRLAALLAAGTLDEEAPLAEHTATTAPIATASAAPVAFVADTRDQAIPTPLAADPAPSIAIAAADTELTAPPVPATGAEVRVDETVDPPVERGPDDRGDVDDVADEDGGPAQLSLF